MCLVSHNYFSCKKLHYKFSISHSTQVLSSVETKLVTVREETLHRTSDEPTIVNELDSPELQHHYLLSDNMELDIGGPRLVSPLYPANQTKIWQLKIPRGCKMFISFQEFAIESSDQCKNDYFSVQTSKDPNDVVAFCDSLHEMEIKFRRRVQFTLHSDHSVNNGKLAAHVCLSKMESDRNDCDCFVSEKRRRAALSCKYTCIVDYAAKQQMFRPKCCGFYQFLEAKQTCIVLHKSFIFPNPKPQKPQSSCLRSLYCT